MLAIFNRQDIRYQCRFLDSLFKLNVNQATSGNMDFPDFTLISFMIRTSQASDLCRPSTSMAKLASQIRRPIYTVRVYRAQNKSQIFRSIKGVCHFQQC